MKKHIAGIVYPTNIHFKYQAKKSSKKIGKKGFHHVLRLCIKHITPNTSGHIL